MSKEKKIGFRLYPNTRLKPQKIFNNDKVIESYPLYATVTFNGESIQLRIVLDSGPVLTLADTEQITDVATTEKLKKYEQFVTRIIRLEYKFFKSKFSLKGLGKRLEIYKRDVLSFIGNMTLNELQKAIQEVEDELGEEGIFDEATFMKTYIHGANDIYGGMDVVEFLYKGGRDYYLSAVDYDTGQKKNLKGLSIILDFEIQEALFDRKIF
jgi:hypothetical protein